MKNRQLIKELLEFPMDADVVTSSSEDIELGFVTGDDGESKSDAKIVFIDGRDIYREDD